MSINVKDVLQAPILRYDTIDSTNNRAAQMIDADKSVPGLTIVAAEQTAGKGQRGNTWKDEKAQSLLMSIVLQPKVPVDEQFSFSAAVAIAIAGVISDRDPGLSVRIKFPNDIIINDKKAAGMLIENTFRGSSWTHAVAGIGINVHQRAFDESLPNATSLFLASGTEWDIERLMQDIRNSVIEHTAEADLSPALESYNAMLYKRGKLQAFSDRDGEFNALIAGADRQGRLVLQPEDGIIRKLAHGQFSWIW